jgi:hypothetical protein
MKLVEQCILHFKNNDLIYNIELSGKRVIQFEKKRKTEVDLKEKKLILAHIKKQKLT